MKEENNYSKEEKEHREFVKRPGNVVRYESEGRGRYMRVKTN